MDGKVVEIECPAEPEEGEVRTRTEAEWKGCKVAGAEIIAFAEARPPSLPRKQGSAHRARQASNGVVYTIDGVIPVQD